VIASLEPGQDRLMAPRGDRLMEPVIGGAPSTSVFHNPAIPGGEVRTWFLVMTLCFSRHQYVESVRDQSAECAFTEILVDGTGFEPVTPAV